MTTYSAGSLIFKMIQLTKLCSPLHYRCSLFRKIRLYDKSAITYAIVRFDIMLLGKYSNSAIQYFIFFDTLAIVSANDMECYIIVIVR